MAYIDEILGKGEQLLKQTHRHPFSLIREAIWPILAVIALLLLTIFSGSIASMLNRENNFWWAFLLLELIPLIIIAVEYVRWRNHLYAVTNRRVIRLTGVVNKNSYDVALEKINDILSQQNGFGRIFNAGDLQIESGNDEPLVMNGIADPLGFKKAILNAKSGVFDFAEDVRSPALPPAAAMPPSAPITRQPPVVPPTYVNNAPAAPNASNSAAEALRTIETLREQNLITEQEYAQKRAEILSRITR